MRSRTTAVRKRRVVGINIWRGAVAGRASHWHRLAGNSGGLTLPFHARRSRPHGRPAWAVIVEPELIQPCFVAFYVFETL